MKRAVLSHFLPYAVAFLVLEVSLANAQTVQEIARKAFSSTVLLVMEDVDGQPLSLGSGFFVGIGKIASNLHVVEGAVRGYAKQIGQKTKHDLQGIVAVDRKRDLVVLKIGDTDSSVLPLGDSDFVQVGESVYAVGNPQGLEGTFSQGIVSGIRSIGPDKLLQITAPISPGSSGGPVLNGSGEIVGVSVATFKGGQNLNFAIPSNYLKALIANLGPTQPLVQGTIAKSQRSILADLGGRSSESVVGSHFSWDQNPISENYTFSVRNLRRESVRDVVCLIIFFADDGLPINTEIAKVHGPIDGNLAVRSRKMGRMWADEVRDITAKVEIRILDFRVDGG